MDIDNNKCLLAYAKMIKDKYENGELLTYLYPKIDNFITYSYGQLRGFYLYDTFNGKKIEWDCDGENYYKIVIDDSELNLDSFGILDEIDPHDVSFFEIEGIPVMEYESDYNIINYILDFLVNHFSTLTKYYQKNPNDESKTMDFYKFVEFTKKYFYDWNDDLIYFDDKIQIWDCDGFKAIVEIKKNKIVFKSEKYKILIPTKKP